MNLFWTSWECLFHEQAIKTCTLVILVSLSVYMQLIWFRLQYIQFISYLIGSVYMRFRFMLLGNGYIILLISILSLNEFWVSVYSFEPPEHVSERHFWTPTSLDTWIFSSYVIFWYDSFCVSSERYCFRYINENRSSQWISVIMIRTYVHILL